MSTSEPAFSAERVAALLLSLDQETAADLLALLEPGVMASVTDAMAKIDVALLEAKSLTSLYASLARDLHGLRTGTQDQVEELLDTSRSPTERSSPKERS